MLDASGQSSADQIDDAALASIIDSPAPAPSQQAEEAILDETSDLDDEQRRVHIRGQLQDIIERKKYALHILRLVVGWLALMSYILLAQGYQWSWFSLPDNVLI